MKADNPIESPCIRICLLDEKELCIGCRRSISEIMNWSQLSNDERTQIVEDLPHR